MKIILAILISLLLSTVAFAQKTPTFSQYDVPVENVTAQKINFAGHPKARKFRTNLNAAPATGKVDFAGHFIIAEWGCGSGCTQAAIIDAKTGKVFFPQVLWEVIAGDISLGEVDMLTYKKDSRLLVIAGYHGKKTPGSDIAPHGISYFEWTGKELKLLKFIKKPIKKILITFTRLAAKTPPRGDD